MNQKTYQKLVDKIIGAVPGIMDLEFGCKIVGYDYISEKIYGTGKIYKVGINESKGYYYAENIHRGIRALEIKEIIGRDITVLDITKTLGGCYAVNGKGALFELQEVEGKTAKWIYKLLPCTFDFNKPLQSQSDETLEGLANLLK